MESQPLELKLLLVLCGFLASSGHFLPVQGPRDSVWWAGGKQGAGWVNGAAADPGETNPAGTAYQPTHSRTQEPETDGHAALRRARRKEVTSNLILQIYHAHLYSVMRNNCLTAQGKTSCCIFMDILKM